MAAKKKTEKKETKEKDTAKSTKKETKASSWWNNLKKNPKKKWTYITLVVIVLLAILVYWKANYFIVATVNGEPISRYALMVELEKQGGQNTLEQMVTKKIIEQKAREAGNVVTQVDVDAEVARIEESLIAQGADLETMLSYYGQDRATFEDGVRQNTIIGKLFEDKVVITDEQVLETFESNKEQYGEEATLEDLKDQIYYELFDAQIGTLYQEWYQEQREESDVKFLIYFPGQDQQPQQPQQPQQ